MKEEKEEEQEEEEAVWEGLICVRFVCLQSTPEHDSHHRISLQLRGVWAGGEPAGKERKLGCGSG